MKFLRWPYWARGGAVAVVIVLLGIIYQNFGSGDSESRGFVLLPFYFLMLPINFIFEFIQSFGQLGIWVLSIIYFATLGMLIGLLYGKIRGKLK